MAEFARLFAKKQGLSLDNKTANCLISWVGIDEWRIRDAIEKRALIGEASEQNIREFVPQNIESNAFVIIEMIFLGDILKLQEEFSKLKITDSEDGAFRFLGMISTQIFNLAALRIGKNIGKTTAEISKEIGANTWALGKMESFVQNLSESQLAEIVSKFTQIDEIIKTESVDPWNLVESTILEIASKLKS